MSTPHSPYRLARSPADINCRQTRQKLLVAFKKQLKAFGDEIGTIRDLRATSTNARVAEGANFNEELGRILAAGGIRG